MTRFNKIDQTRVINKAALIGLAVIRNAFPGGIGLAKPLNDHDDYVKYDRLVFRGSWYEIEAYLNGARDALDNKLEYAPSYDLNHENCAEGNERWAQPGETVFITEDATYAGAKASLLDYVSHRSDDVPEDWDVRAAKRAIEDTFSTVGKLNRRIAKSKADTSRIVWYFRAL